MAPLEPNSFITALADFLKSEKHCQDNGKLMGYEMYQILYSVLVKSGDYESAAKLSVEQLSIEFFYFLYVNKKRKYVSIEF